MRRRPGHSMPEAHFDALASGYGDAEAISALSAAQGSVRRALLRLLRDRADGDAAFAAGWDLLARLDRSAAVAGTAAVDEVLAHPYVRAWAEGCLRSADAESAAGPAAMSANAGHLASIAAAAAIRSAAATRSMVDEGRAERRDGTVTDPADVDFDGALAEVEVPVIGGYVHLPTLGRLRVGDAATATLTVGGAGAFEVIADSGKWHIEAGDIETATGDPDPDWQPVRELRAGNFAVRLEDTDPYRNCHQWPPADRLTAAEAAGWQAQFTEAWELIEASYPRYAPGVAAGLRVLLPLANDVPGREISAAARQAFGAVAAALPASGADLALLIIHEFQHVKLGALTDLFDLCDRTDHRLFFAPWRDDPRPLGALLQGTYAHIGVTDYWRLRRHLVAGPAGLEAAEKFARWRIMTAEAVETLSGSGALTPLGIRFAEGMRGTVKPWLDEPVPDGVEAAARDWAAERRAAWRQRQEQER